LPDVYIIVTEKNGVTSSIQFLNRRNQEEHVMSTIIYTPYVYRVESLTTSEFYYGVKYAKGAHPDWFWKDYFTSSKIIKSLIKKYGKDDFKTEIVKTFKTAEDAAAFETNIIRENIHKENCVNMNVNGATINGYKMRLIKGDDGLTSYHHGAQKGNATKLADIDENGLNGCQRAYYKAVEKNPDLHLVRTASMIATLSIIGDDGLSGFQRRGLQILGENNPVHNDGVKDKISKGIKRWNKENPEAASAIQVKAKAAYIEKGCAEAHSQWMLKNNPTSASIWCNNGKNNLRIKNNEPVPEGYVKGRLPFKSMVKKESTCPHCNFVGKGGGMKRYHFENCKHKATV
jgi:hypothetical protein